ncbi:hypothetical protein [Bacillus sp. 1P06AnD]|uniref:hypothetical protein n=1 Tax=Bacillus sp. 1P06AnD TaxID=3132208 RepID=UPI0039A0DEBD
MININLLQGEETNGVTLGKFESLNFIIDHEKIDFIGYEFEVEEEVYIEEFGDTQWLFRMNIYKETNEITVYCAYSQDYDLMEDATDCFDLEKLQEDIKKWTEKHEVSNHGDLYVAYIEGREQHDMDCEDAMSYAQGIIDKKELIIDSLLNLSGEVAVMEYCIEVELVSGKEQEEFKVKIEELEEFIKEKKMELDRLL